jgi:Fe-S cluster assembly protein SufD
MSALIDSLKAGFGALPASLVDAAELGDARRNAFAAAATNDLPTPRAERWKYTALRALAARTFATAAKTSVVDVALLTDIPAPRMVFVNGAFSASLSDLSGLPEGVELQPLSRALVANEPRAVNFMARRFEATDEAFAQLNAALASDGALLRAQADARSDVPIHLVFAGAPADADLAAHSRHLIELRENARLIVVEHHLGTGAHRHLFNHLVHVHLQPGSELIHARVQDETDGASLITRTDAVLASMSNYRRVDLELGAALSRHELNVSLQGEGARVHSSGTLLAAGRQHVDTRLGIEHVARDTSCDLLWRGLAAGRGRAVFHGGIVIRAGADGASAALSNKNLLLSESAEIDTQPVLEIHADEVAASHGATVGRLDPTHLFYLRARGIPESQARGMLTAAFCRETLTALGNAALIESLTTTLDAKLSALEIGE